MVDINPHDRARACYGSLQTNRPSLATFYPEGGLSRIPGLPTTKAVVRLVDWFGPRLQVQQNGALGD